GGEWGTRRKRGRRVSFRPKANIEATKPGSGLLGWRDRHCLRLGGEARHVFWKGGFQLAGKTRLLETDLDRSVELIQGAAEKPQSKSAMGRRSNRRSADFSPFQTQCAVRDRTTDCKFPGSDRQGAVFRRVGSKFVNKQSHRQCESRRKENIAACHRHAG